MNLGPHAGFIIAAYLIAALVVIGLIIWIEVDNRVQRRNLARLAAQGVTRRSGKSA
jgi:heme exporter protein D